MRMPAKVKKAIEILAGYCEKHRSCEDCPLNDFCSNVKPHVFCDWASFEKRE